MVIKVKKLVKSIRIPPPGANYSPGFIIDGFLFISGLLATDYKTGVPPEAKTHPEFPWFGSNVKLQAETVVKNLKMLLEDAGTSLDHVVKANIFMLNPERDYFEFSEVWDECFHGRRPPEIVAGIKSGEKCYWGQGLLGSMGNLFEVDVTAVVPSGGLDLETIEVNLPQFSKKYSVAVRAGGFLFTGGLVATDYKTGIPPEATVNPDFAFFSSEIKLQTRYVLNQLIKILEDQRTSLSNVVKVNVYLKDVYDYVQFHEVWEEFFQRNPPARTVTIVEELLGAKGCRVMVEAIAVIPDRGVKKEVIVSKLPKPYENFSLAVKAGNIIFTSGLVASDWKTGILPQAKINPEFPWFESEIKSQVDCALEMLKTLMEEAGCSMRSVAKCFMYLVDLTDYHAFTEMLPKYFPEPAARTVFEVSNLIGPTGARFEIEAIAAAE